MIDVLRPFIIVALCTLLAVTVLAIIAMITDEHHGQRCKPRARASHARPDVGPVCGAGPKGTMPPSPAGGAVPPHPRYGNLHHTPPGGITVAIGEHAAIRVGGTQGVSLGTQPRRQPAETRADLPAVRVAPWVIVHEASRYSRWGR